MAGRPTFTTEPSTNARLEARMVTVSTSRGWALAPSALAAATPASQEMCETELMPLQVMDS